MKNDFCLVCGNKENITIHHMREINAKKKIRGKLNGVIYLCRGCHDIVEDIVNKAKSKRLWFERGYKEGLKESGRNLLQKNNHIVGCMLEGYESILRFRGYEKEANMLLEVASKIK